MALRTCQGLCRPHLQVLPSEVDFSVPLDQTGSQEVTVFLVGRVWDKAQMCRLDIQMHVHEVLHSVRQSQGRERWSRPQARPPLVVLLGPPNGIGELGKNIPNKEISK